MDSKSGGIKVEHDGLLFESEGSVRLAYHSVDIAVDGLLKIDLVGIDLVDVLGYLRESLQPLLELKVAPPLLDAVSCASSDDQMDWQLLERLSKPICSECLLYLTGSSLSIKKWLEEAKKLLIFIGVHLAIVVKDCKQDRNN